jgi:phosphotriesterase-related protein
VNEGMIVTVHGPVRPEDIGVTSTHEHLLSLTHLETWFSPDTLEEPDKSVADAALDVRSAASARWNLAAIRDAHWLNDHDEILAEARDFKDAGGDCLVAVTPIPRRDHERIARLSEDLGLHIVLGAALTYPPSPEVDWVREASVQEIADFYRREIEEGIAGSDIRPGTISEVVTTKVMDELQERMVRGAARAGAENGLSVHIHTELPTIDEALRIVDAALSEGLPPGKVVVGHLDYNWDDPIYYIRLLRMDVNVAIDSFGMLVHFEPWNEHTTSEDLDRWNRTTDDDRIDILAKLLWSGYEDQIVLGHDVSFRIQLKRYGGYGYDHLLRRVLPRLQRKYGFDAAVIEKLLVQNPRRVFTVG